MSDQGYLFRYKQICPLEVGINRVHQLATAAEEVAACEYVQCMT